MRNSLKQFSGFVGELNIRARHSNAQALASWAVGQLSETVGFDSAWYGWAELKADSVEIHAQALHNLTDNYYDSWREISEQDLLAPAVRENPRQTAVYDRAGTNQTDGMISLADRYGLKKMATAMHARAGCTSSFYLSSYRGGHHSRNWSSEELNYLHCAVGQLSSIMELSVSEKEKFSNSNSHSFFVNEDGIVNILTVTSTV